MYLYYCLSAPIDTVSFKKHIYMKMVTAMNYILLLEINTKYRIKMHLTINHKISHKLKNGP